MPHRRRQSSIKPVRDRADDDEPTVSPRGLTQRLTTLETVCGEMKHTLDVQFQRIAAIQAQPSLADALAADAALRCKPRAGLRSGF